MKSTFDSILEKFIPFVAIGIAVVLVIAMIIMFFYLFIWGVILGAVIWLVVTIKNYFSPKKAPAKESKKGRIIEHDKE